MGPIAGTIVAEEVFIRNVTQGCTIMRYIEEISVVVPIIGSTILWQGVHPLDPVIILPLRIVLRIRQ